MRSHVLKNTKTLIAASAIAVSFSTQLALAEDVGPECRGVAAGVVAAMRSSGEITSADVSEAAIVAARRACAAALGELGGTTGGEVSTQAAAGKEDDKSMWDFLSQDQEKKPGNERLRRLRQF